VSAEPDAVAAKKEVESGLRTDGNGKEVGFMHASWKMVYEFFPADYRIEV